MSRVLCSKVEIIKRKNFCVIIDHKKDKFDILHPSEAFVLNLLNGYTDQRQLVDSISTVYSIDRTSSKSMVDRVIEHYSAYLVDDESGYDQIRYDFETFLFPGYEELSDLPRRLPAPLMITLDLTQRCNFRCRYCYYGKSIAVGDDLPLEYALQIIDAAAAAGVILISIGGAEFLLYPDFLAVVQRIKQHRMLLSLTTNGSFLNSEIIDQMVANGIESIGISIDTSDPDMHHYLTQSTDTFDKIVAGIRLLKTKGVWVRTVSVITRQNIHCVATLIDFLMELGIDAAAICPYSQRSCNGMPRPFDGSLTSAEMLCLSMVVDEKMAQYKGREISFDRRELPWQSPQDIRPCSNLFWGLVVHRNGDVFPCELIEDASFCFGNVFEIPIVDVWQGTARQRFLCHTTNRTIVDQECGQCSYLPQCRTGCFNRAEVAFADYFAKDPRCPGWHVENTSYEDK